MRTAAGSRGNRHCCSSHVDDARLSVMEQRDQRNSARQSEKSKPCPCHAAVRSEYVSNRSEALYNAIIGDDRAINDFVRQKLGGETEDDAPVLC